MACRHPPIFHSTGRVAGENGDSYLDDTSGAGPNAGLDRVRPLDSDMKDIRTDVPERLDLLLPGEAALVYHYLRDRLATLFDHAGK